MIALMKTAYVITGALLITIIVAVIAFLLVDVIPDERKTNDLQENAFKSPLVVTLDIDHLDWQLAGRETGNGVGPDDPMWSNSVDSYYSLNLDSLVFALPVIYESEWPSLPLPVIAKDWISKRVNSIPEGNPKPWFMLRIAPPGSDKTQDWDVNVYFLPEQIQGRVCKGKFIHVDSTRDDPKQTGSRPPSLTDYYHVLPPGQAFTNDLPAMSSLPFQVEGTLDAQSLIALVDAVRPMGGGPIAYIDVQEGGRIEVQTATSGAFLAGRGKTFILEKQNGKWVVIEKWDWLS